MKKLVEYTFMSKVEKLEYLEDIIDSEDLYKLFFIDEHIEDLMV